MAEALTRIDRHACETFAPRHHPARRRELLSTALLLTDAIAPEVCDAAREAMATLHVDDDIELFQSHGGGVDNARLALVGHPIGVEFIGGYLVGLDRASLLAVLGHEIGHALAHSGHAEMGWAYAFSGDVRVPAKRLYRLAAELTADRFGLLACRDLDAALRLEMRSVVGRAAPSLRRDAAAFLAQCRRVVDETRAGGTLARGWTHPEHYVRGYAAWLFSESDLYASITGRGGGKRPIAEVDAELARLLGSVVGDATSADLILTLEDVATGARQGLAAFSGVLVDAARAVGGSRPTTAARPGGARPNPFNAAGADLLARFDERRAPREAVIGLHDVQSGRGPAGRGGDGFDNVTNCRCPASRLGGQRSPESISRHVSGHFGTLAIPSLIHP